MHIVRKDISEQGGTRSTKREIHRVLCPTPWIRRTVWQTRPGDMASESVIGKNEEMGGQQKWRPENRGSNRKMVIHVARGRVLHRKKIPFLVRSSAAESRVGPEPVLLEIEIVLDEQRPAESVVSDAVAAHPRIDERERQDEKKSQNLVVAREPSQSASSLNESEFCSRLESPRDCDCATRRLSC